MEGSSKDYEPVYVVFSMQVHDARRSAFGDLEELEPGDVAPIFQKHLVTAALRVELAHNRDGVLIQAYSHQSHNILMVSDLAIESNVQVHRKSHCIAVSDVQQPQRGQYIPE